MRLVADLAESERRIAARRAPAPSEADLLRRELAELRVKLDDLTRSAAMLSSRLEEETARRTRVERDLESARRQPQGFSEEGCLFDPAVFDSAIFDTCEEAPAATPSVVRRRFFTLLASTSAEESRLAGLHLQAQRDDEEVREILSALVPLLRAA